MDNGFVKVPREQTGLQEDQIQRPALPQEPLQSTAQSFHGEDGEATGKHDAPTGDAKSISTSGSPAQAATEQQPAAKLKPDPKHQVMLDKICFFVGVINLVLSAFWVGKSPATWHRWFTLKALVLFTIRYRVYKAKHWHYYMLEFCYFANLVLLVQLWVFPQSAWLYKATFSQVAGPMTAAIAALGNSVVLHSLDKTTSLFMHVSPAIMVWCIRWYPSPQGLERRQADPASWEHAGLWDLVALPMLLYSLWAAFYYLKIFVWSSDKVTKGSYSTLYSLMVGKKGSLPARIVLRAPTKLQPLTYMLMHLLMALGATLTSLIWWHSFWAHTAFLVACSSTSVWKGATYQFDIFAHRYLDSVGLEPRKKKAA
ncbi:hypothetical protein WJX73_006729 [Symbiochloris irregularis]|uniref:Glycerophosphocholine acyltransferase 1 n=1 Tax=Symbiochloris irregularis TaxID=706552 RepID=A0AAW1NSB4_9CHLO